MPAVDINFWAYLTAVVINLAAGGIWYAKPLFGDYWAKLLGQKYSTVPRSRQPGRVIPATIVLVLLTTYIMVHFVRYAGALTAFRGAEVGFWLWLGFIAAIMAIAHLFEGRSWKLWQIDAGYWLVVFLINGALLAAWR